MILLFEVTAFLLVKINLLKALSLRLPSKLLATIFGQNILRLENSVSQITLNIREKKPSNLVNWIKVNPIKIEKYSSAKAFTKGELLQWFFLFFHRCLNFFFTIVLSILLRVNRLEKWTHFLNNLWMNQKIIRIKITRFSNKTFLLKYVSSMKDQISFENDVNDEFDLYQITRFISKIWTCIYVRWK